MTECRLIQARAAEALHALARYETPLYLYAGELKVTTYEQEILYAPEAEAYLGSLFEDNAPRDEGDLFVDVWVAAFVRDALVQLAAHSSAAEARSHIEADRSEAALDWLTHAVETGLIPARKRLPNDGSTVQMWAEGLQRAHRAEIFDLVLNYLGDAPDTD